MGKGERALDYTTPTYSLFGTAANIHANNVHPPYYKPFPSETLKPDALIKTSDDCKSDSHKHQSISKPPYWVVITTYIACMYGDNSFIPAGMGVGGSGTAVMAGG